MTLAHEYNHILQFGYDFNQDTWFLESTAVWMEGKVFPAALDYLQYLPGWVQLTTLPLTTFNGTDPNDRHNLKVYGTAVWNKWLDAQFGPDVIRGAWESSLSTTPSSFAVAAYDSSIRQHGGQGFADQFDRFAAATAEWQASNSGFPEGSLYPDVERAGNITVNGAGGTTKLNHTTYTLLNIPPTSAPQIRLGMSAPAGTAAAVAIVGRTGAAPGGTENGLLKELPKGGAGSVTIANPSQYSRLTAVLVNSDAKLTGAAAPITGDFVYAHDNQAYYARVSTDFKSPHVVRSSPSSGRKRRVDAGQREDHFLRADAGRERQVAPADRAERAAGGRAGALRARLEVGDARAERLPRPRSPLPGAHQLDGHGHVGEPAGGHQVVELHGRALSRAG